MKKHFETLENLPFSAVVFGEKGEICYRNRMARGLLLPPAGMSRFFEEEKEKACREGVFTSVLDGRRYFAASMEKTKGQKKYHELFFFEDFGLLFLPVSEYLLEECSKLLEEGEERFSLSAREDISPGALLSYCKRLSLRTRRFRDQRMAYQRMNAARNQKRTEEAVCSVSGFFSFFTSVIQEAGFSTKVSLEKEAGIKIHPDFLAEIFLNLFQFVSLFEGERDVEIQGEVRQKDCLLTVSFFDRENLFSLFGNYLLKENKKRSAPRFAAFSPLFTAALLCDGAGLGFSLEKDGEKIRVRLSLPLAEQMPERFLSAKETENMEAFQTKVKEFFGL